LESSKYGQRSVEIGSRNRDKILNTLLNEPLTFSKLKEKVGLSGKTLTNHLNSLLDESLVKREIQGKYVVYVAVKPKTLLNMRKTFRNELNWLLWTYSSCLSNDTKILLDKVDKALEASINQPEPDADKITIAGKTIPLPKETEKGTVITQDSNLYKKPRFESPKKSKTRGRQGNEKLDKEAGTLEKQDKKYREAIAKKIENHYRTQQEGESS
jgi:DNA-binding transcriptional ArsR family regulator